MERVGVGLARLLHGAGQGQQVFGPLPVELADLDVALAHKAHQQEVGHAQRGANPDGELALGLVGTECNLLD